MLLEHAALLARTEIRVHDVKIDERDVVALFSEINGEIDGKVRLSHSVMSDDQRYRTQGNA